jgi:hypothetical protein
MEQLPPPAPTEATEASEATVPPPVEVVDISSLLSQETNYIVPPASVGADSTMPPVGSAQLNPDDFELPPPPVEEPAGPDYVDPATEPRNRQFYLRQSRMIVRSFDVGQKTVLGYMVYPKTLLEPGDKELLRDLNIRVKQAGKSKRLNVPTEGDGVYEALKRFERLEEAIKGVSRYFRVF